MIDLSTFTDADRVVLLEQVISSVDELCSQLQPSDWDLPTDCPAWSVKDNLSHLAHFESVAARMPQPPERPIDHLAHVSNDFQRGNELGVEARRASSGPEILEEFRTATSLRLKEFAGYDDAAWEADVTTPLGVFPLRAFLPIRITDFFYHEQDIRRATNNPGHLEGHVARFVFTRFATLTLPRSVSKGAGAPDGSVVVFDVGAPGEPIAIRTEDGKGALVDVPPDPTVRIAMDGEAFFLLVGGRQTPEQLAGRLRIDGDAALARAVLEHITVVP